MQEIKTENENTLFEELKEFVTGEEKTEKTEIKEPEKEIINVIEQNGGMDIVIREDETIPEKLPEEIKPKDARGRHPVPCNRGPNGTECDKCKERAEKKKTEAQPVKPEPQALTPEEQLKKDLDRFTVQPNVPTGPLNPTPTVQPKLNMSQFISGALFLVALDYSFPIFLKYVVGYFDPKYKSLKPEGIEKLKLTKSEREYLEPSAEELVKYIFSDANPILVFMICTAAIYGGKFALLSDKDFFDEKQLKQ